MYNYLIAKICQNLCFHLCPKMHHCCKFGENMPIHRKSLILTLRSLNDTSLIKFHRSNGFTVNKMSKYRSTQTDKCSLTRSQTSFVPGISLKFPTGTFWSSPRSARRDCIMKPRNVSPRLILIVTD